MRVSGSDPRQSRERDGEAESCWAGSCLLDPDAPDLFLSLSLTDRQTDRFSHGWGNDAKHASVDQPQVESTSLNMAVTE